MLVFIIEKENNGQIKFTGLYLFFGDGFLEFSPNIFMLIGDLITL